MNPKKKGRQGFASMDPQRAREIQVMGGKASRGGGRKRKTPLPEKTLLPVEEVQITNDDLLAHDPNPVIVLPSKSLP